MKINLKKIKDYIDERHFVGYIQNNAEYTLAAQAITPGWYRVYRTGSSQINDLPTSLTSTLNGVLKVEKYQGSQKAAYNQTLYAMTHNKIFYRDGTSSQDNTGINWTDWKEIVTTNDIPDISNKADKIGGAAQITDTNSQANYYSNLGLTTSGQTQEEINKHINDKIGIIQGTKFIEITSTKPTASKDTMNKLYIVSETVSGVNQVNVYYTEEENGSYTLKPMDTDILDNLPAADTNKAGIIQIGTGALQAAAGNHTHKSIPYTRTLNPTTNPTTDADLNTLIEPGWYNVLKENAHIPIENETTQGINNIPEENIAFRIEVQAQHPDSQYRYLTQIVYTTPENTTPPTIYYRKRYGSQWSEWQQVGVEYNKGTHSSGDLNADSFTQEGWYNISCTANSINNIPAALNNITFYGRLEVKQYNNNYKMQILYVFKSGDTFPRIFYRKKGGSYAEWDSTWKEIADTDTYLSKTDASSMFIKNNDSRLSDARTPLFTAIPASSDLDTYRTGGFYYCGSDSNAKTIKNCPKSMTPNDENYWTSNKAFFLLVETWGASSTKYVKQTLTYYNDNTTSIRTKHTQDEDPNEGWTDWKEIADTDTYLSKTDASSMFIKNNDSRLSDTRTPTNGSVTNAKVASNANIDFSKLNITKNDITGLGIPESDTNTTYTAGINEDLIFFLGTILWTDNEDIVWTTSGSPTVTYENNIRTINNGTSSTVSIYSNNSQRYTKNWVCEFDVTASTSDSNAVKFYTTSGSQVNFTTLDVNVGSHIMITCIENVVKIYVDDTYKWTKTYTTTTGYLVGFQIPENQSLSFSNYIIYEV